MPDIGYQGAAQAGLLSFLSPCLLPLLPFYLCYLTGISLSETRTSTRLHPIIHGAAFALGITTIFVLLGLRITTPGRALANYHPQLSLLAAAILGLLGLSMLLLPWPPRQSNSVWPFTGGPTAQAYVIGLSFGFGWTPCAGPALAAILSLTSDRDSIMHGGTLLLTYGLAMTLPFVLISLCIRPVLNRTRQNRPLLRHMQRVMGVMLILFAALIATGRVQLISGWLLRQFDWSFTII